VFNMGCGLCAMVPEERGDDAVSLLAQRLAGAARIGRVTDRAGVVALPGLGLVGDGGGLRST
jgi:phosphoribosylaminoimidazole (AIR) synthetase